MNRRDLLQGAGVALLAGALRPTAALAAADEGGLLTGLWRREMGAALAYGAVLHVDPLLALLRAHETHHAFAMGTELAAVGLGTPRAPLTPAELDSTGQRLAEAKGSGVFAAAIALEESLVEAYTDAIPHLPDENIAMTAATILGSHAQHLLILRRAAQVT